MSTAGCDNEILQLYERSLKTVSESPRRRGGLKGCSETVKIVRVKVAAEVLANDRKGGQGRRGRTDDRASLGL